MIDPNDQKDTSWVSDDEHWLTLALELAKIAAVQGDVPVGAIVVSADGQVVGQGFNQRESMKNPLAHAEMIAIQQASTQVASWRLDLCTLYVTLEPCVMCAGAIVASRLGRLVYGATDEKAGGVQSLYAICEDPRLNHRVMCTSGVLEDQCTELLGAFFADLRLRQQKKHKMLAPDVV